MLLEMPETMRHKGEMMGTEVKDQFLEEVDQALRSINSRLKKAFSRTEVLLKEHFEEKQETQESNDKQTEEG
jgi:hypothetical protein